MGSIQWSNTTEMLKSFLIAAIVAVASAEPWSVSYGNGHVNRANLYNNGVNLYNNRVWPVVRNTWGGRTWGKRSADAEPEADAWSVGYAGRANLYNINNANLYNNRVWPVVRNTWGGRRTWGKRSADAEPEADAWSVGYAGRANLYNINYANLYNNRVWPVVRSTW